MANISSKIKVNELINLMANYCISAPFAKYVQPIMLWGSPGVGKSQAMKQVGELIAKKLGKKVNVIDIRLVNFSPVDLRGIPVPNEDKTEAVWLKPSVFQMDESPDVVNILILDEISAAAPSVQASAYQIVLDRRLGEHLIPDNCLIMCAGNRITDKSVAYKMPKALENRLIHLDVSVDFDDWKTWALPRGFDSRIIGFLNWRQGADLDKFDPSNDEHAFCTPRTWEKVNSILSVLDLDTAMSLISGTIGDSTSHEFYTYTRLYGELPNMESILAGKCTKVPTKPDVSFALVSALVCQALKSNDVQLANILEYSFKLKDEFKILLLKDLIKSSKDMLIKIVNHPKFEKFTEDNMDLLRD